MKTLVLSAHATGAGKENELPDAIRTPEKQKGLYFTWGEKAERGLKTP